MGIQGNWEKRRIGSMASLGEIDRRTFVKLSGASAAALVFGLGPFTEKAMAQTRISEYPFTLGVASGDPQPDGVVLWTRLAPNPLEPDGEMPRERVQVRYEVATDESFSNVVRSGTANARPELAHSVHVEVEGLQAGREYYYRFEAGGYTSDEPRGPGRTKTAPALGSSLNQLAFAFASCQMYEHGFFNAYNDMVQQAETGIQDLDFVIHLGDYIYEYEPVVGYPGVPTVRLHQPADETDKLSEYRVRHAQYKTDEFLQAAHETFPFIVTWDDHEVENNYADDIDEKDSSDEDRERRREFLRRRAAAYQSYYEHMPLRRLSVPQGPDMRLYRRFTYGDLAEFNVLDTRQYRVDQARGDGLDPPNKRTRNPRRTLTGERQERWLFDGLKASNATWDVLAQQVFFSQLDFNVTDEGKLYNMDQWDGYEGQRDRMVGIIEALNRLRVRNPIVLTGDIHINFANDIKNDFDKEDSTTVGTEYVGTSVTSNGNGSNSATFEFPDNPHIKFANDSRGYVRCRLDKEAWRSDYRVTQTVTVPGDPAITLATFVTPAGEPGANLEFSDPTVQSTTPDEILKTVQDSIEAQAQ